MRTAVFAALAATFLAAAPAGAAPRGEIRGRVVNQTTGEPQPGVQVKLSTARDDGSGARGIVTTTDERGRYVFEDLPTGDDRYYTVDARFDGGLFAGGVVRLPGDTTKRPVVRSKLRVWETTTDPGAIVVRRDSIFVVPSDSGAGVIEAVVVANIADEAYIGRGTALGANKNSSVPSLGFAVPPGAEIPPVPIVESDIDIPELVETSFGFAATVAIPPGQWRVVYSYGVPGDGGTYQLSRPALYPTLEVGVYAGDPLRVEGGRIAPDGTRDVRGNVYDFYSSDETLEAGDRIDMVVVAEASAANLLAIGGGALALAAIAAALVVLVRRRSRRDAAAPARSREQLVEAIARLDLAKEQGLLPEDEWAPRRAQLKQELEATR